MLASAPTPDELAGQQTALAMFTAVRSAQAQEPRPAGKPVIARRRSFRPRSFRLGSRLAAAATVVALACGFAAAAYAAALPAPLQHVAYQILGFAGVPDSPGHRLRTTSPGQSPSGRPTANRGDSGSPATSRSPSPRRRSPSPKPRSSSSPAPKQSGRLTVAASAQQITAGGQLQITASLTEHGKPEPDAELSLLELRAGKRQWRPAGRAATDAQGQAVFTVPDLATNAWFRVTGAAGSRSAELSVVVVAPVSASLEPGPHPRINLLLVDAPLAQRG